MYGFVYGLGENTDGTCTISLCIDRKFHANYLLDGNLDKFIKLNWVSSCDQRCFSALKVPMEVEQAIQKYNSERKGGTA